MKKETIGIIAVMILLTSSLGFVYAQNNSDRAVKQYICRIDVNGDRYINALDIGKVVLAVNDYQTNGIYNELYDLNADGKLESIDADVYKTFMNKDARHCPLKLSAENLL